MVGAGWEAWVARQWSIGGALALNWAWMEDKVELYTASAGTYGPIYQSDTAKVRAFSPTLLFTSTFN
jgi:hypothetical protein